MSRRYGSDCMSTPHLPTAISRTRYRTVLKNLIVFWVIQTHELKTLRKNRTQRGVWVSFRLIQGFRHSETVAYVGAIEKAPPTIKAR